MRRLLTAAILATTMIGCRNRAHFKVAGAAPYYLHASVTNVTAPTWKLETDGKTRDITRTFPADARRIEAGSIIHLVETPGADGKGKLRDLVLKVGKKELANGPCLDNCAFRSVAGYMISTDVLVDVPHDALIEVTGTTESGISATSFFRYTKRTSWSGIGSPILLRASGKAAGFRVENLAPSISSGIQFNRTSRQLPFIGINGLVTVFEHPETEDYALSLGADVDLSGLLQLGSTYRFDEKKWFLVVGTRFEILSALLPRTATASP
jgi:hypothetical protein